MSDIAERLAEVIGARHVLTGEAAGEDYTHDEAVTATPASADLVVLPGSTADVSTILALADEAGVPVTARGSGTGLSGACIPQQGGIVVSFERMNAILEIDTDNHMAVVQPGVT